MAAQRPGLTQALGITQMVFGDPAIFAIEVALEPGSSARFMGREPLGRIRALVQGNSFGAWDEPSCPFGALANELREKADESYLSWHPSLEPKSPTERFRVVDDLLHHPTYADRIPSSLDQASILTNTVECFDGTTAFALTPSRDTLQILVSDGADSFAHCIVEKTQLGAIASALNSWIRSNRRDA